MNVRGRLEAAPRKRPIGWSLTLADVDVVCGRCARGSFRLFDAEIVQATAFNTVSTMRNSLSIRCARCGHRDTIPSQDAGMYKIPPVCASRNRCPADLDSSVIACQGTLIKQSTFCERHTTVSIKPTLCSLHVGMWLKQWRSRYFFLVGELLLFSQDYWSTAHGMIDLSECQSIGAGRTTRKRSVSHQALHTQLHSLSYP